MKAREVKGLDPRATWRDSAALILETRLDELNQLSGEALEPGAEAAQHEMRIAAKRVRYLLDLAGPCVGGDGDEPGTAAQPMHGAVKRLQGVLGEMHDCDVLLPRVAGISSVESLLRTRRELLFARFRELWDEVGPLLGAETG